MKARKRGKASSLPLTMTGLALASWETIMRRTMLISQNRCSASEYQRMVLEKTAAAAKTGLTLLSSGGLAPLSSLIAPWHAGATANAKRLRKKSGR